jgi:hypothetical protein
MADSPVPSIVEPVTLTLDRPRRLRLEIGDVLRAEREICRVWQEPRNILSVFTSTVTLTDLTILLWAALLPEEPSLTLEQVQRLCVIDRLGDIMAAVVEAWNRGMQSAQPPNGAGAASPFPTAYPGSGSGATPVLS